MVFIQNYGLRIQTNNKLGLFNIFYILKLILFIQLMNF